MRYNTNLVFKKNSAQQGLIWMTVTLFNSLWPNDAIQRHRSGSTLPQVMANAWQHQAITWTNVDLSSVRSCIIHLRTLSKEALKVPISKASLKIEFSKLHPNPPGANELIVYHGIYPFILVYIMTSIIYSLHSVRTHIIGYSKFAILSIQSLHSDFHAVPCWVDMGPEMEIRSPDLTG